MDGAPAGATNLSNVPRALLVHTYPQGDSHKVKTPTIGPPRRATGRQRSSASAAGQNGDWTEPLSAVPHRVKRLWSAADHGRSQGLSMGT